MDPEMASRLAALERRVKILEAVLQRVAIAVAAALEELRAHCENSRRTLSEQFEAALGALTACGQSADLVERYGRLLRGYVDETVLCLETMETQKAAALEGEQVGVDGVLERTSDVLGEVSGAATMAESDFALEVALSALVASLEGASAAQPRGPVEPNLVCITPPRAPPADAIAAAIASPDDCERLLRDCIGRLVAVRAASTDDLRLSGRPKYAVADRPLRLALVLCDAYGHLPSDDLAATLRHAAGLVHGSLSMEPEGDLIDAPVSAALNPDGTCIWVTFALPAGLRAGSSLTLDVTVAGVRPSSSDGMPTILPTSVRVVNGLPPDFRLRNVVNPEDYCMPAVSLAARMYRPCDGPDGPVCSYDSQGVLSLLPRRHELLGFNTLAIISMAEGTGTNPFIVALLRKTDMQRVTFVLVAVPEAAFAEGSTLGPLWTASLAPSTNLGLAVLPRCGIVVSSHCSVDGSILVHDLKTGALLSQAPARYATHIAADDESRMVRMVFASVKLVDGMFGVGIFRWDGVSLTEQGAIPDLRVQNKHIAIAAVPPGPGRPSSHLVACPRYEGGLRVYALPSLALLHTHELGRGEAGRDSAGEAAAEERPPSSASEAEAEQSDPESVVSDFANDRAVQVTALAADPSGTALIVSDQAGDKAVYAVAWPPPGVPPAAMA